MGYFSNGTSFMFWYDGNCPGCLHEPTEERGCPIQDVHQIYASQLLDEKGNLSVVSEVLEFFIPEDDDGQLACCTMRIEGPMREERGGQTSLPWEVLE